MKRILFPALVFLFAFSHSASAQTAPRVVITWEAATLAPAGYEGQRLSTSNSLVTVSMGVISDGKIMDLSDQNVYWYINDSFFRGGIGLDRVLVETPEITDAIFEIRAELPDSPEGLLKTIRIPVVSPKMVIQSNRPAGQFRQSPLVLGARAFYFNVSDIGKLAINWEVNGVSPKNTENPSTLVINLPESARAGYVVNVRLLGKNPSGFFEGASKQLSFLFNP